MKSSEQNPSNPAPGVSWDVWLRQSHEQAAATARRFIEQAPCDEALRARLTFALDQCVAASHPDNFLATNAEALRLAVETKGQSVRQGLDLLMRDVQKGRVSNTDETAFEVGRNLAVTPGKVVLRNELIELIQYAPTSAKVGKRPLVVVPPCINKYYILDLSPHNSFVRYAVEQGNTVFVVSWRNPDEAQAKMTWDDYLQLGVVESLDAACSICKVDQVNALGFCVGGTILSTALAALEAKGENPAASLTLLTTLLDFKEVGPLGVFIDPASVAYREAALGQGGILPGKELAATFSFLRPRDLLWNYVANGYLKGEAPLAFDLLYWNADSTNLPGPMYAWYLRNMYLENRLVSGELISLDEPINLKSLKMPAFVYASKDDHIVPWQSAFLNTQLLGGETSFVMGASGHIAGVINPPDRKKRSHWVAPKSKAKAQSDAKTWLANAEEKPGSWWPLWADWIRTHHGGETTARRTLGNGAFKPGAEAPGEYVKVRT